MIGAGSFSSVARAVNCETGEKVALKRIPDILSSTENAKRVLREICILRRLRHPGVIRLVDAFHAPSPTAAFKYRGGKFVPSSQDLYLALEYCEGGDLFTMRGQLSMAETTSLTWQILEATRYLHEMHIMHRDLKSANVLLRRINGKRIIKLADLGSARSATEATCNGINDNDVDDSSPKREGFGRNMTVDCELAPAPGSRPQDGGWQGVRTPLTRTVCTPCYRAPEVIMSRGRYSSAVDMWSCGAIYGELLSRVPRIGGADNPHLAVQPLVTVAEWAPATPRVGDRFNGEGREDTHQELQSLFDVIGTPAWACIENVPSRPWRAYLRRLPGQAPSLYRRFGHLGEVPVDLLARLMAFDPSRRASAGEAQAHEFFRSLMRRGEPQPQALQQLTDSMNNVVLGQAGAQSLKRISDKSGVTSTRRRQTCDEPDGKRSRAEASEEPTPTDTDMDSGTNDASAPTPPGKQQRERYYEIANPAVALAALEDELAALGQLSQQGCVDALRELIEAECDAAARDAHVRWQATGEGSPAADDCDMAAGCRPGLDPLVIDNDADACSAPTPHDRLQLDPNNPWHEPGGGGDERMMVVDGCSLDATPRAQSPHEVAELRRTEYTSSRKSSSRLAGASQAPAAEHHLQNGRHGDWTESTGHDVKRDQTGWGVFAVPPGFNTDPALVEAVKKQQRR